MALVTSLLELPITSTGFSALQDQFNDGSTEKQAKLTGPFIIKVIGEDPSLKLQGTKDRDLVHRQFRHWVEDILAIDPARATSSTTYEKIFASCRTIVTVYGDGARLYDEMKMEMVSASMALAKHLLEYKGDDVMWLGFFSGYCKWFESKVTLLQSLLSYLDQVYVVAHRQTTSPVRDLAYGLFSERIFGNFEINKRLRSGVSIWLQSERDHEHESESREQVAQLIKYIIAHKQYFAFEELYIELTQSYYKAEAKVNAELMKDDPAVLLNRIELRIQREVDRAKALLPVGSGNIVLETTETALLRNTTKFLADSLVPLFFARKEIDRLGEMYNRFARVKALKDLSKAFQDHIQSEVKSIVTDTARDEEMVQRLLDIKKLADTAIAEAFSQLSPYSEQQRQKALPSSTAPDKYPDKQFVEALSKAFNAGFRARHNKPAEMIAKYIDKQLRKGQKGVPDAVFQAELITVLPLYRYTEDKDVFRTFYHRMLAKRLLLGKSASVDIEKWLLKELTEHYDREFGTAEEMFQDLNLSKEMMEEYHDQVGESGAKSGGLNVMVLKQSSWPFSRPKNVVDLPADMQMQLSQYTDFYKKQHKNRALHWDHALGTATLRSVFNGGVKELSVSLFQAVVLLLFNHEDEIPFKEILEQTGMEEGGLRRTLQSLACGKKKVLKKIPPGRDVDDSDVFKFNADFTDPLMRVHINTIQAKVSAEETRRTNDSIEGDRISTVEAAIVRVMKAKKEMHYEQLKVATIEAVKSHFVPTVELIKKGIDGLVDREYLERDQRDLSRFTYLA